MRTFGLAGLLLIGFLAAVTAVPAAVRGEAETAGSQTIAVADTRTSNAPCGFPVRREIAGTIALTPTVDAAGKLVLAIDPAALRGSLANPANGASVDLRWVLPDGDAAFRANGSITYLEFGLTGRIFPGYDLNVTDLDLSLPADGAAVIDVEPQGAAEEPWAHVCELLS